MHTKRRLRAECLHANMKITVDAEQGLLTISTEADGSLRNTGIDNTLLTIGAAII